MPRPPVEHEYDCDVQSLTRVGQPVHLMAMETKMFQLDRLQQLKDEILRIAVKNNARKVYVFGSCARKEETSESDIDFVADFKDHSTLFNVVGLELDLAEFLGCSVDVVTLDRLDMNDAFAKNVKKDMVLL